MEVESYTGHSSMLYLLFIILSVRPTDIAASKRFSPSVAVQCSPYICVLQFILSSVDEHLGCSQNLFLLTMQNQVA